MQIKFELEKLTKNTARYQEVPEAGKPHVIGTLYVQKWAVPEGGEQSLTVTIKAG